MKFVGNFLLVRGSRAVRDLVRLRIRCHASNETASAPASRIGTLSTYMYWLCCTESVVIKIVTIVCRLFYVLDLHMDCIAASCVRFSYPGFKSFISRQKFSKIWQKFAHTVHVRLIHWTSRCRVCTRSCEYYSPSVYSATTLQLPVSKVYLFAFNFLFSTFRMILPLVTR